MFKRHTSTTPYLNTPEMISLAKTQLRNLSPKGVSDYDTFDDNVMYGALRPDHVFKQIENHKWNNALVQLTINRHIAQQWVVNAGTRRLPIHEACVRKPTTEIIYTLLDIYPDGAKAKDSNGRHPIHHACVHGASADTIYQLLHVFPESANANDNWGKTPKIYALNTVTPDVDVIQALFHKSQYDIETFVSRINKVYAVVPSRYDNYGYTQKSSQIVPYDNKTVPTKSSVESRSNFDMVAQDNALEQTDIHPYSAYTPHTHNVGQEVEVDRRRFNHVNLTCLEDKTESRRAAQALVEATSQRDTAFTPTHNTGQDVEVRHRINHVNSVCLANKTESRRAAQALVEATTQRDTTFSRMGQLHRDSRKTAQSISAAESQRHDGYDEVARLQHEVIELKSQMEETKYLTLSLSRAKEQTDLVSLAKDNALRKVAQLENKIQEFETQLQVSKRANETIMKKDVENDMLRNINKDLRGTILSLSSKLDIVMKDLDSAKEGTVVSNELINEVRRLQEFRHIAENKIEDLEGQESGQAKIIDNLNDELEELNSSYFDVTNALVVKSKDYFMLKAKLDQKSKVNARYDYC